MIAMKLTATVNLFAILLLIAACDADNVCLDDPESQEADCLALCTSNPDKYGDTQFCIDRSNDPPVRSCQDNTACEDTDTPVCDTARNLCVACLDDTHCADATPRCNPDNNACVACLQTSEEDDCSGNLCLDNLCSQLTIGGTESCDPCEYDRQCEGNGAKCIALTFQGVDDGRYCLQPKVDNVDCARPFTTLVTVGEGDRAEAFCGIDQENVSCGAVRALETSTPCGTNGDATSCGGKGAVCRQVGGVSKSMHLSLRNA